MNAIESIAAKAELERSAAGFVSSPCISVCIMSASSGLCDGCLRTLDEIAAWSVMDDEAKRQVWAWIGQRAARVAEQQA
jgi:uncharacterized protein